MRKNSVLIQWLTSYMLLLFIAILFCAAVFLAIQSDLEEEIMSSNEMRMGILQRETDEMIEKAKRVYLDLAMSADISVLLSGNALSYPNRIVTLSNLQDKLKSSLLTHDVDNALIYFDKLDMAISLNGMSDGKTMYDITFAGIDFEEWKALVLGMKSENFMVQETYGTNNSVTTSICYTRPLPLNARNLEVNAVMVVIINGSKFINRSQTLMQTDGSSSAILEETGEVILRTDRFNETDTKGSTVIMEAESEVSKWKYVIKTPRNTYWKRIRHIRIITFVLLGLTLLIGITLSIYMAVKNYSPVKKLLNQIEPREGNKWNESGDEYSYLLTAFENALTEQTIVQSRLEKQEVLLRQSFLTKLAKGESYLPVEEQLERFKIEFVSEYFAIAMLDMIDVDQLFPDEKTLTDMERYELSRLIIVNITEELLQSCGKRYFFETDSYISVLINFSSDIYTHKEELLANELEKVAKAIETNFGMAMRIAVSCVHSSRSGISGCYQESYEVIEYMRMTDMEGVEGYLHLRGENSAAYYYPIDKEIQLTNCIKSGDTDKTVRILDEIFAVNLDNEKMSLDLLHCLMFDLMSTLMKISIAADEKELLPGGLEKIMKVSNINEMKNIFYSITENMCIKMTKSLSQKNYELENSIRQYVQEHYSDQSLSVQMIGDAFSISPYYLSKLFREETNEGLMEYIRKVRITKAKVLFESSDDTQDTVAQKVGYLSAKSLIRAFKQVEGITPGKYKEMLNR